jgi:hypothetical protein
VDSQVPMDQVKVVAEPGQDIMKTAAEWDCGPTDKPSPKGAVLKHFRNKSNHQPSVGAQPTGGTSH